MFEQDHLVTQSLGLDGSIRLIHEVKVMVSLSLRHCRHHKLRIFSRPKDYHSLKFPRVNESYHCLTHSPEKKRKTIRQETFLVFVGLPLVPNFLVNSPQRFYPACLLLRIKGPRKTALRDSQHSPPLRSESVVTTLQS